MSEANASTSPAAAERLMVPRCLSCQKLFWYPRPTCPFCLGEAKLEAVSGKGTVYTYSVTRRAGPTPYCIAYVELEEGPRMLTHIADSDFEAVRIGSPVEVFFREAQNGARVPVFKLS